jgi:hypothetical protein
MQPSFESTEDGTEVNPRESMALCVAIMKLGGLMRTKDMPHRDSILYNVRQAILLLLYYTFVFSIFVYLFVAWGNFSDIIETISYAITVTVTTLKMNVIMFRSDEVQHIVKTVQENFLIHGTKLSIENRNIIKNAIKQARQFTVAYLTMRTIVLVVFLVGPLITFDVMLQTHNTTNISSETIVCDRKLPVRIWTPLDVTQSPHFEIAYTYIVLTVSISTLNWVVTDIFCLTTLIYLTGQFELLCDSIRNASEKVKYRIEGKQHSSAGSNGINKRREFTADKKTKIRYSRADTKSIISGKGKGNIIEVTHKSPLKQASVRTFSSDILRMFLLVYIHTKFRSDVLIFVQQYSQTSGVLVSLQSAYHNRCVNPSVCLQI